MKHIFDLLDVYFRPKSFEVYKKGLIYRLIGIKQFRLLVMYSVGYYIKIFNMLVCGEIPTSNYFIGSRPTYTKMVKQEKFARFSEAVHLICLILTLPLVIFDFDFSAMICLILNFYLVSLQRYTIG
jgi:hypothetical protein